MLNFMKNKYDRYYEKILKSDSSNIYTYNKKYLGQDDKLLSLYGKCDKFDKRIKFIIIADTHGSLQEESLKLFLSQHNIYDACILLGDYSYQDISIILKYIPREKIYALLGNHDGNYIQDYNLTNLNGNIFTINSVKILGIQGSYRYKNASFPSFSEKESIEFLKDKEKVDILFSHDAPFGLSGINDIAHQGLFGINYYLYKNQVPICIHGHVHTPYVKHMKNGTLVRCCYLLEYIEL